MNNENIAIDEDILFKLNKNVFNPAKKIVLKRKSKKDINPIYSEFGLGVNTFIQLTWAIFFTFIIFALIGVSLMFVYKFNCGHVNRGK